MTRPAADARSAVLDRIRAALAGTPAPGPIPRDYLGAGELHVRNRLGVFEERLRDYGVVVGHCAPGEVRAAARSVLNADGVRSVIAPTGFPAEWSPVAPCLDEASISLEELDRTNAVVTTCAVGVALTGTIVLDSGPGQGSRRLTLIPDYHLVVIRADQVVTSVPDAVRLLDPRRPLTWISGPSATSDIELNRVAGVHGPRRLAVLIAA